MNLYLIIFTAGTYKVEQVYEKHKDLFVELEKHFTLHLVNYTDSESIPSHEYKMAFIASRGVENAVVRFFQHPALSHHPTDRRLEQLTGCRP